MQSDLIIGLCGWGSIKVLQQCKACHLSHKIIYVVTMQYCRLDSLLVSWEEPANPTGASLTCEADTIPGVS